MDMMSWNPGDRVALVRTDDPDTRLRPGDQGTVTGWHPEQGQLLIDWDSGSSLIMLPGEGDEVRVVARTADRDHPATDGEGDALTARAEELGRAAGTAAVSWAFHGIITTEDAWARVVAGIDQGDLDIIEALEPAALGAAAGYTDADLARDLGIAPGDPGLPRAADAYSAAFTSSFQQEAERAAREHALG